MLITISGPPGSGKTEVCKRLSEALNMSWVSAGQIFRDEAEARGISLDAFTLSAEKNENIDIALDEKLVQYLRLQNTIVEGRMAGVLATRNNIPAFRIRLFADEEVRAGRVCSRENEWEYTKTLHDMRKREISEKSRYHFIYKVDVRDAHYYSLFIDTTDVTLDQVVETIVAGYRWLEEGGWH